MVSKLLGLPQLGLPGLSRPESLSQSPQQALEVGNERGGEKERLRGSQEGVLLQDRSVTDRLSLTAPARISCKTTARSAG